MVGLVGAALVIAIAACQPTPANETPPGSGSQVLATVSGTSTPQQTGAVVWGRVPYCNCLADSATANVAGALKDANLTVNLQELSPRDGWLVGAQIGLQHHRVRNPLMAPGEEARYVNLLLLARLGYEWHPRSWPFYLFPWLGAALTPKVGGESQVGAEEYDVPIVMPYGAVELGWRF